MNRKPASRTGFSRLYHAFQYSVNGIRAAFRQKAFQLEIILFCLLLPPIILLPMEPGFKLALLIVNSLVLIVELLNTALEILVDLVCPEYNKMAGQVKDLGSAAVLLSLILAAAAWIWIIARQLSGS